MPTCICYPTAMYYFLLLSYTPSILRKRNSRACRVSSSIFSRGYVTFTLRVTRTFFFDKTHSKSARVSAIFETAESPTALSTTRTFSRNSLWMRAKRILEIGELNFGRVYLESEKTKHLFLSQKLFLGKKSSVTLKRGIRNAYPMYPQVICLIKWLKNLKKLFYIYLLYVWSE